MIDATDEPLTLRQFNYDDGRQTAHFAFIGTRKGSALAISGITPVTFGGDPTRAGTDQSIKAAIRALLHEAAASITD